MKKLCMVVALIVGCGGSGESGATSGSGGGGSGDETSGGVDTSGKSPDELRIAYDEKYEPDCAVMHREPESDAERLVIQGDSAGLDVKRGTLSKAKIKTVIDSRMGEVRKCYDELAAWWPEAEGTVMTRFGIGEDGKVIAVRIEENDIGIRTLGCCILGVMAEWQFPEPEGGVVIVNYPYEFGPAL